MSPRQRERVTLFQGALTYRDARFEGYDAAVLMEVIEHLDPERLPALERTVFGAARPRTVIVTTPNVAYNVRFEGLPEGQLRHRDHRFEWDQDAFAGVGRRRGGAQRLPGAVPSRRERRPGGRAADADGGVRAMTTIAIPKLSLVVLVGVSGSGKSTFAARHFLPTEVLSSDACRALVGDDANDQTVTREAFDVLHTIAATRLGLGRLTVVDATNVQPDARKPLVRLAREHHVLPVAIVLDVAEDVAHARNADRPDRDFGPHVVRRQAGLLRRSIKNLQREGFRRVFVLKGADEIDARRDRARAGVVGPHRPARTVRPDRRRARLRGRARASCSTRSATRPTPRACDATPTAAWWSSSATWSTAVPTRRRCSAPRCR